MTVHEFIQYAADRLNISYNHAEELTFRTVAEVLSYKPIVETSAVEISYIDED